MKKIIFAFWGSLFMFSCGPAGVKEETKAAINQLEVDITSVSEQMKALSVKLAASKDSAASYCNSLVINDNLKKSLKEKVAQADSIKIRCNALVDWYETAGIEVAALTVQFGDESQAYSQFKESLSTNTVIEDSAAAVLRSIQTKLENSKNKIVVWNQTLDANNEEVSSLSQAFRSLLSKK